MKLLISNDLISMKPNYELPLSAFGFTAHIFSILTATAPPYYFRLQQAAVVKCANNVVNTLEAGRLN